LKYLLLALPLVTVACTGAYGDGYVGNSYYSQYPTYAYGYGSNEGGYYYGRPYYGGENCGTPDEPKGCPPLPRHPLPYYPGDRW
jgi:hypothetical protein